jgi:AraC family transcriptional regulator, regulatory protein of adaptative response / DNA-3-methyladenine glycosylase II
MLLLDPEACYRAVQTRDRRFDGSFFTGVVSTGIYCRPICPARTAMFKNCRFYASAAAAQEAGFRPCLRCRPEIAPSLRRQDTGWGIVPRALALIEQGWLDSADFGLEAMAERLGVSSRHLRRLFQQQVGATPVAVAQTRRVLLAKQLLHDTRLPIAEVALAAGFGSVRRFNEKFQVLFRRPPKAWRRLEAPPAVDIGSAQVGLTLRLPYQPPYDWDTMLQYRRTMAVPGIERVDCQTYARTVFGAGYAGWMQVRNDAASTALRITLYVSALNALPALLGRAIHAFDVGADVRAINEDLCRDADLAVWVHQRPGLRLPSAWNGFEWAVQAVIADSLGAAQVQGAMGQLVELCGTASAGLPQGLTHHFPTPAKILRAPLAALRMRSTCHETLRALAQAAADERLFAADTDPVVLRECLRRVQGVSDRLAATIIAGVINEPDTFTDADEVLLRSAQARLRIAESESALAARALKWRPWRAYAMNHLRVAVQWPDEWV